MAAAAAAAQQRRAVAAARTTPSTSRRLVVAAGLADNVKLLPNIDAVARIRLQPTGHEIPNMDGKRASVAIYQHLALKYDGALTPEAAAEGLALYAEVVDDARAKRGAHPNIDVLLDVLAAAAPGGGQQQGKQQQLATTIVVEKL